MGALKNAKEEKFAHGLVRGLSQRKAYLEAYPSAKKWTDKTVDTRAYELANKREILERYREIVAEEAKGALLDREEKRAILAEIARNKEEHPTNRIKAIDTDNKMENEYIQKLDVQVNQSTVYDELSLEELKALAKQQGLE